MSATTKTPSNLNGSNIERASFNDTTGVIGTEGWLSGKVGRKVELAINSAIEVYTFSEDGVELLELTLTYTDSTRETLSSAERTA